MDGNLMLCNCGNIIGCEVKLVDACGVAQKLCKKTCLEPPKTCERRKYWLLRRFTNNHCPVCEKAENEYD